MKPIANLTVLAFSTMVTASLAPAAHVPAHGEHTGTVLAELGNANRLNESVRAGIVGRPADDAYFGSSTTTGICRSVLA